MSDLLRRLLTPITPGALRAIAVMFVLMVALAAFNLLFTAREVDQLRAAVQSECAFAADVGNAPVTGPNVSRPSKLGVSLVADSRAQFRRLGCPGHLPLPQSAFVRWARFYHLPAG